MDAILDWGMEVIRAFQNLSSPVTDAVFTGITFLGREEFYLLIIPLVFWCFDRRKGIRLTVVVLLSHFINQGLKEFIALPRPFDVDPSVGIGHATGYSLPSGHAQGSLTFWGMIAPWIRRGWPIALVLSGLIGISRVYLGVHYPSDVLAGWAIAGIILGLYFAWGSSVEVWILELSCYSRLLLATGISLFMVLLNPADTATPATLLGASAGLLIPGGDFSAAGPVQRRVLRYLLGIAGTVVLYVGLSLLFPGKGQTGYALLRFIRYTVLGLWITFGAPWVFLRIGLALPAAREADSDDSEQNGSAGEASGSRDDS